MKLDGSFFKMKPNLSISTTESVRRLTKWIDLSSMPIFRQKLLDTATFASSGILLATVSCVKYTEILLISIIPRHFHTPRLKSLTSSTWSSYLLIYSIGILQLNLGAPCNSSSWLHDHIPIFDLHRVYEMTCI